MSDKKSDGDRIAKVMARAGVASRRDAERLIVEGRVTVNGEKITSPALDVLPTDRVALDGKPIDAPQPARLWLYYKPLGLVTSEADEKGRQTVFESLPEGMPRVMSVGRLDLNSEGLLLLTNDGGLKRRLELPSTGWLRKYRVRVNGRPNDATFDPLRRPFTIDAEEFQPMEITLDRQQGANAWLTIGLREGKNREIRRAMAEVGLTVNRLIRVSYGPFRLNKMEPGDVTEVKQKILREQLGEGGGEDETTGRAPRGARPDRPGRKGPPKGPAGEGADRPRKPRAAAAGKGAFAGSRDRGGDDAGARTFRARPEGDDHPRQKRDDRPGTDRKSFGAGPRGKPRADDARPDGARTGGARPERARGDRVRSEGGWSGKGRPERSQAVGARSDRPRNDRFHGDGPSSNGPSSNGPRGDRPKSDRPKSDRPQSDRLYAKGTRPARGGEGGKPDAGDRKSGGGFARRAEPQGTRDERPPAPGGFGPKGKGAPRGARQRTDEDARGGAKKPYGGARADRPGAGNTAGQKPGRPGGGGGGARGAAAQDGPRSGAPKQGGRGPGGPKGAPKGGPKGGGPRTGGAPAVRGPAGGKPAGGGPRKPRGGGGRSGG